jgi:hypothetical protein
MNFRSVQRVLGTKNGMPEVGTMSRISIAGLATDSSRDIDLPYPSVDDRSTDANPPTTGDNPKHLFPSISLFNFDATLMTILWL